MADETATPKEKFMAVFYTVGTVVALYLLIRAEREDAKKKNVFVKPYYEKKINGLGALPEFPALSFEIGGSPEEGYYAHAVSAAGVREALVTTDSCDRGGYSSIEEAYVKPKWRGQGLYPVLLTKLRDAAQKDGCAGIVSKARGRHGGQSTASWEKFASQEPRVREEAGDYYFNGLPTHGRIPLATAKRALKKLPKNRRSCRGLTPDTLRVGMEIEREHRDITQGRVGQTAKIAAAHICERPDYYKRIKRYVEK